LNLNLIQNITIIKCRIIIYIVNYSYLKTFKGKNNHCSWKLVKISRHGRAYKSFGKKVTAHPVVTKGRKNKGLKNLQNYPEFCGRIEKSKHGGS
jgi:hypothetical protein